MRKQFERLNKKILKNSGLVWGVAFLLVIPTGIIFGLLHESLIYVPIFLFWALHPYICYVLARNKDRSGLIWAFLGAWFWAGAIIVINRLQKSDDYGISAEKERE